MGPHRRCARAHHHRRDLRRLNQLCGSSSTTSISGSGNSFGAYTAKNSGIPVASLTTSEFRSAAEALFGLGGSEQWNRSAPGWLTPERVDDLLKFCTDLLPVDELFEGDDHG